MATPTTHIQRNRLSPPAEVVNDLDAFEVLRIWSVAAKYEVSLRPDIEPFAWGLLLADVARKIALKNPEFLDRMLEGFHAEIENPTE
jgi:hypothetical protein